MVWLLGLSLNPGLVGDVWSVEPRLARTLVRGC